MPRERKFDDEELFAMAVRLAVRTRGKLSLYQFCDAVGVSPCTINRRFGGWIKFRERAGLPPVRSYAVLPVKVQRKRLVEQLRKVALRDGWEITAPEFCRRVGVSTATIQRLFGSWRQLRKRARLPARNMALRQRLVLEALRLNRVLGHFPSPREIARKSRYGVQAYKREFGSYRGLLLTLVPMVHEGRQKSTDGPAPAQASPPPM